MTDESMKPEGSNPEATSEGVIPAAASEAEVVPGLAISPTMPARPSLVRRIFLGREGLRAVWSLLLLMLVLWATLFVAGSVIRKIYPHVPKSGRAPAEMSVKDAILRESVGFLAVLFVTWILAKVERRSFSDYGLGGERKVGHFFAGLGWGLLCLSLLVLTLWKTGLLVFDGRLIFGRDVIRYGAAWLVAFFVVGLFEESFTRGYLQYTLTRGLAAIYRWVFKTRHGDALGFWTSAAILSILFGLGHRNNPGESPIGMLSAGLAGLVFCFSLWRTGSLWWAIGVHTSWDWAQSFLYGVADSGLMTQHHLLATHPVGKPILSGGTTGPEGSIFAIVVLCLVAVIILLTLPGRRGIAPLDAEMAAGVGALGASLTPEV